jgi:hypothetical protein
MATKLLSIALVIDLTICAARVQSQLLTGSPFESPSPAKYRTHKKIEARSEAETTAEPSAAESPAASPKPKRTRKKRVTEASPTPTPTPSATPSPHKFRLPHFRFPRLFKPKTSASPSPLGVNPAPARFADPRAAQPQGGHQIPSYSLNLDTGRMGVT